MKSTITVLTFMALSVSSAVGAAGPDPDPADEASLAIGQDLRAAAEHGDTEAMMRLAIHLDKFAPDANTTVNLCDGKAVSPLERKNLETQGHDCRSAESPANNALMEKWRAVGYKSDFDHWSSRAAEQANPRELAILCAREEEPSAKLRAFCARFGGSLNQLKASAFTSCALITETVARLLLDQGKSQDAIDYYQNATNDYLAGAKKLVTPDEFRTIFGEETRKIREKIQNSEGDALEPVVQTARECAQALEGAP